MTGPSVLVTGANGFVGRALLAHGAAVGLNLRGATRQPIAGLPASVEVVCAPELAPGSDWSVALHGIDLVVHCAARVHVMREKSHDPLAEFRRVNTAASLELAVQAAAAGVRRMVFVSTVFVNGLETVGTPFRADDPASPTSPYAVSKHEAELGLREISRTTGMELVIIRPPLVYGPGVRGNFARLVGALRRGVPMPLGAVDNRRSLVGVDNLVDLILRCSWHPNAAQQSFLVSDGEDLSTTELLRRTAHALDRKALLLPIPPAVLRLLAAGLGQHELGRRLLGSLQVDISKTCAMLGWSPPVSLDEGLRRAVSTTTLPASRGVR